MPETTLFLLTPLREGRLSALIFTPSLCVISTHAPAGGATRAGEAGRSRKGISTHAPAGGATRSPSRMNTIRQEFLLTPLREGRHKQGGYDIAGKMISTHAPAGGATKLAASASRLRIISTHAPAGGATDSYAVSLNFVYPFLLTPLREGRPGFTAIFRAEAVFLLTPLREGRHVLGLFLAGQVDDFYSRPCGRGDRTDPQSGH